MNFFFAKMQELKVSNISQSIEYQDVLSHILCFSKLKKIQGKTLKYFSLNQNKFLEISKIHPVVAPSLVMKLFITENINFISGEAFKHYQR